MGKFLVMNVFEELPITPVEKEHCFDIAEVPENLDLYQVEN